jgi:hypothetical protein
MSGQWHGLRNRVNCGADPGIERVTQLVLVVLAADLLPAYLRRSNELEKKNTMPLFFRLGSVEVAIFFLDHNPHLFSFLSSMDSPSFSGCDRLLLIFHVVCFIFCYIQIGS